MYLFIHQHIINIYYVLGSVLTTVDKRVGKKQSWSPLLWSSPFNEETAINKVIRQVYVKFSYEISFIHEKCYESI